MLLSPDVHVGTGRDRSSLSAPAGGYALMEAAVRGTGIRYFARMLQRSPGLVVDASRARSAAVARLVEPAIRVDGVVRAGMTSLDTSPRALASASRGVVLLGDSIAVSAGVTQAGDTLGAHLARLIEHGSPTPGGTRVTSFAVSGATSRSLDAQLAQLRSFDGLANVDQVLVSVGGNDVLTFTGLRAFQSRLNDALLGIQELRPHVRTGLVEVPPMGNATVIPKRLRGVLEARAVEVRRIQHEATSRSGASLIETSHLYGVNGTPPVDHVARDGFHPSSRGYAHAAARFIEQGFGA